MPTTTKRLNPKTGKCELITLTPAESAQLRAKVSRRYSKDGKDLGFQQMIGQLKLRSKRKLRPAA